MKRIPFWPYLNSVQKASLVTALLGFVISFTTTVSSGGVTVHRNWAALAFGVLTLLLGLASVPEFLRSTEHRSEKLIAFVIAILIGALHVARGLGVFYGDGGEPRIPTPIVRRRTPITLPTPTPIVSPTPIATPTPSASEHMDLGMEYYEQGRIDEAIAEWQAAIELEPDNANAHRNLGTTYLEQGKYEEAAVAYEKAIELDPDFGEAYGDLVGPYIRLGRLAEAIAAGEKAIELAPDYAMAHNNLGVAYKEQGQINEAIAEFKEATRLDPDHAMAHNNLGRTYSNQGQFDEAIAALEEAIRINPDYADAHYNLGLTYARQKEYDKAIAEYEEVLKLQPDHTGAHFDLGIIYRDLGMSDKAIAEFETYLQLRPNASDRAAVEEEIAKLKESAVEQAPEYRNAVGGYSVLYPKGWYYHESGTVVKFAESQAALEVPAKDAIREIPVVFFNAGPLTEVAENTGMAETADDPAEFLQAIAKDIGSEAGEIETAKIASYPASAADILGTYQGTPHTGGLAVVLVEKKVVYGVALVPSDQWEAFRPIFIAMVNSLSFFEP